MLVYVELKLNNVVLRKKGKDEDEVECWYQGRKLNLSERLGDRVRRA
jgi:hypothetical protein